MKKHMTHCLELVLGNKNMRKTYKYTYKDIDGHTTTLKKSITDKMQPIDDLKKEYAAEYFSKMLEVQYRTFFPVVIRNIQEV